MLFVIDHQPIPLEGRDLLWQNAGEPTDLDPARVIALPELTPLSTHDVTNWLDELAARRVCALSEKERWNLAKQVTDDEGLPISVYDRLQRAGFYLPQ